MEPDQLSQSGQALRDFQVCGQLAHIRAQKQTKQYLIYRNVSDDNVKGVARSDARTEIYHLDRHI